MGSFLNGASATVQNSDNMGGGGLISLSDFIRMLKIELQHFMLPPCYSGKPSPVRLNALQP